MSIFNAAMERNQTGLAKKEDLVPISVKITKKVPYYDWTEYYVQFKNENTKHWVRWNFCFPKSNMKVENILPILAENGLDTKNVAKENWNDLVEGIGAYQEFKHWQTEQWKTAEKEGMTEKDRYIDYTYTSKKLPRGSKYLVTVTMRMYGQWRKFRYVFNYNSDMWEYKDDQTGKTRYTPISEALDYDVEGMIGILPHTNLTKEEWDDDNFFKDLYSEAKRTVNEYNSRWW